MRSYLIAFFMALAFMLAPQSGALAASDDSVPTITAEELKARMDRGDRIVVIDTRVRGTYAQSDIKIKGAIDIPLTEVDAHLAEIPFGRELVTYCT